MSINASGVPGGDSCHCTALPELVIRIETSLFSQTGVVWESVGPESARGNGSTPSMPSEEAVQPFSAVTVTVYSLPLSFSRVNVLPRVPSSIFREASTNCNSLVFSGNVSSSFDHCRTPLRGGRGRVAFLSHLYSAPVSAMLFMTTRKEAPTPGQTGSGTVSLKTGNGFTVSTAALEASSSAEARQPPSALNDFTRYR